VKFHDIKAEAEPSAVSLKAPPGLDADHRDSPPLRPDEMDLAHSLRTLFSLFDDRHPIKLPKR